jgi:hypothetical protein
MSYRQHGFLSVILFFSAIGVALTILFLSTTSVGIIYSCIVVIGSGGILFSFCTKCPCRDHHCSHVILGPLSKILPNRQTTPYSNGDILGLIGSFLIILVFPQMWIWKYPFWGILFWALTIAAVADILNSVCPQCKNIRCPLNRSHE